MDQMSHSTALVRLLVGVLLIQTGAHASSCPIELHPSTVVVKYGGRVSINCSTKVTVREGISWRVSETGIGEEQVNIMTWDVKSLKKWNFSATCHFTPASTSTDQPCKEEATVIIYTFPQSIDIEAVELENEERNFTCDIRDVAPVRFLTVNWHKGDQVVSSDTFSGAEKEPVNETSVYHYTPSGNPVTESVRCEAVLNLTAHGGPELKVFSQLHKITVRYPPSKVEQLEDVEVDTGASVTLKCSSKGNPPPTYSWTYYQAPNVVEKTKDGESSLHIHHADGLNVGNYTCNATNEKGSAWKTVQVVVRGADKKCPIQISPDRLVLEYRGMSDSVMCRPACGNNKLEAPIYWLVNGDKKIEDTMWNPDTEDWTPRPVCVANFMGIGQCKRELNFTLYKIPDSVSIHTVDVLDLADGGKEIQLQCNITDVAPAQNLVVLWYQKTSGLDINDTLKTIDCLPKPASDCSIRDVPSQQNVSSTISVKLNRTHNSAEFSCGARLDFGSEGPELPYKLSERLNITVNYMPVIDSTKLPRKMTVLRGDSRELICDADGHPPPRIQWFLSSDNEPHVPGNKLVVSEAGLYNCSATNEVGSASHVVEVILKDDHLPLIAGFVAATLVATSFISIFIYAVYYKSRRNFRYNLKKSMFSTQKGDVAQNNLEMHFPMTKLT